jgi:hypothetical protein
VLADLFKSLPFYDGFEAYDKNFAHTYGATKPNASVEIESPYRTPLRPMLPHRTAKYPHDYSKSMKSLVVKEETQNT